MRIGLELWYVCGRSSNWAALFRRWFGMKLPVKMCVHIKPICRPENSTKFISSAMLLRVLWLQRVDSFTKRSCYRRAGRDCFWANLSEHEYKRMRFPSSCFASQYYNTYSWIYESCAGGSRIDRLKRAQASGKSDCLLLDHDFSKFHDCSNDALLAQSLIIR